MTRNFALGALLALAADAKMKPICLKSTQAVGLTDYDGPVDLT